MKRREFVEKIGMGSAGLAAAAALGTGVSASPDKQRGHHDHTQVDGPLASATISFGQWQTDPPFDRFPAINETLIIEATPGPPPFPGFIDDPNNRIYRGNDPRLLPQDRVEVITFAEKGTYLVVCAVVPHFADRMHGFVKVV
jgi:hypothetical protein